MTTLIVSTSLIVSFILTLIVKWAAARGHFLDQPNERSLHSEPIPTLGGIAIVVTFISGLSALFWAYPIPHTLFWPLIGGGLVLAAVSLVDDIRTVSIKYRMITHFVVALLASITYDGLHSFDWFGTRIELGYTGILLSGLLLVFVINVYNFIDGVDGMVSLQTVFVCTAVSLILLEQNNIVEMRYLALLGAVTLGFLAWNFAPAHIFMGDVGSVFLGFTLTVLMIYTVNTESISIWTWLILLGFVWVDVIFTLTVRFINKQTITQAHKSHCYQKMVALFAQNKSRVYAHRMSVIIITLINIFWLLPLAYAAQHLPQIAPVFVVIACVPLVILMQRFKAGSV